MPQQRAAAKATARPLTVAATTPSSAQAAAGADADVGESLREQAPASSPERQAAAAVSTEVSPQRHGAQAFVAVEPTVAQQVEAAASAPSTGAASRPKDAARTMSTREAAREPESLTRVDGFSRSARANVALSAYGSGRGHDGSEHGAREKRGDDGERAVISEPTREALPNIVEQVAAAQATTALVEHAPLELPPPVAVPVVQPPPELPDVDFARLPNGPAQGASISLHHPDLGPIEIQVQRTLDKIEVSAVLQSTHAEAVLRANETGIRLGVQQSGMTFGALRLRVRGEERDRDVTRATYVRRRRTNERGI